MTSLTNEVDANPARLIDIMGINVTEYHSVFTKEECDNYINFAETIGFVPALIGENQIRNTKIRNGYRIKTEHPEFSKKLLTFLQEQKVLPQNFDGMKFNPLCGCGLCPLKCLNPLLTFLKYSPGEYFKHHYDSYLYLENNLESRFTILVYLNENFKGGETNFINDDNYQYSYIPKTGDVVIMEQENVLHEGAILLEGIKYAIRIDAMYSYN